MPSRLIGYRLRGRLFDDRLEVFIGGSHLMTLPRGRGHADGRHDQVVNYHHVIHSLGKKAMALRELVYRDKLFPRQEYRNAFKASSRISAEFSTGKECYDRARDFRDLSDAGAFMSRHDP